MPIRFTCGCGKSFTARDDLAGRHVRCSSCRAVVRVQDFSPDELKIDIPVDPMNETQSRIETGRPASVGPVLSSSPPPPSAPPAVSRDEPRAAVPAPRPIPVECDCGRRFHARPELAGRNVRCPACRDVLTIPYPSLDALLPDVPSDPLNETGTRLEDKLPPRAAAARPLAPVPGGTPTPSTIRVACACGRRLAVRPELAGKNVRCPGCRSVHRVPAMNPPPDDLLPDVPADPVVETGSRLPAVAGAAVHPASAPPEYETPVRSGLQLAPIHLALIGAAALFLTVALGGVGWVLFGGVKQTLRNVAVNPPVAGARPSPEVSRRFASAAEVLDGPSPASEPLAESTPAATTAPDLPPGRTVGGPVRRDPVSRPVPPAVIPRAKKEAPAPARFGRLKLVLLSGPGGRRVAIPGDGPRIVHVWLEGCADCMPAFEAVRKLGRDVWPCPVVNVAFGSAKPEWAAEHGVAESLVFDTDGSAIVNLLGIGTFTTLVVDAEGGVHAKEYPQQAGYLDRVRAAVRAAGTVKGAPVAETPRPAVVAAGPSPAVAGSGEADKLLKTARNFESNNLRDEAVKRWKAIVEFYPDTPAAAEARKSLGLSPANAPDARPRPPVSDPPPPRFSVQDPPEKRPLVVQEGFPRWDVVKIGGDTSGGKLSLAVEMSEDVAAQGRKFGMGSDPFEFYLDNDGDPGNGARLGPGNLTAGFEYRVRVYVGVQYANGGSALMGGMKGTLVEKVFVTAEVDALKDGETKDELETRLMNRDFQEADREHERRKSECGISGKEIRIRIPYPDVGIKPGRAVRVFLYESQAATGEDALAPEGKLTPD